MKWNEKLKDLKKKYKQTNKRTKKYLIIEFFALSHIIPLIVIQINQLIQEMKDGLGANFR